MGFEVRRLSLRERVLSADVCTAASCGCDSCPANTLCSGPNPYCDAKGCGVTCSTCRAVCNRREDKNSHLSQLGGRLDFEDVSWAPFRLDLPPVLFQLNGPADGLPGPGFIVNVKRLLRWRTGVWHREKDVRRRFRVTARTPLGLSFNAQDKYLDVMALQPERSADEIARFRGLDFVLAPNFSIWDNYPRFDAILNARRKIWFLKLLQDRGLRVIPDFGWQLEEDFYRMVRWLEVNRVSVLSVNLQNRHPARVRGRWTRAWRREVSALVELHRRLPEVTLILGGCSATNRMRTVRGIPGVVLLDTRAYRLAEHGRDLDETMTDSDPKTQFRRNMSATLAAWSGVDPLPLPAPTVWSRRRRAEVMRNAMDV